MFDVDPVTERINLLTEKIIGCGIEVHKAIGPGLLESAYEECLCYELAHNGLKFRRQGTVTGSLQRCESRLWLQIGHHS